MAVRSPARPPRPWSVDIGYAGGRVRDILIAVLALTTFNCLLPMRILPTFGTARTLDMPQKKLGAGCYTGPDNIS